MPKKKLGIIGGMGPLATADLFRKIVLSTKATCDNGHIRIFIDNNTEIPDRTAAILSGGPSPVPYMADSLRRLEECGAECIVMPCNTAHYYLPQLQAMTSLPFISILDAAASECAERFPGRTAEVLATAGTLKTGIYDKALASHGVPFILPDDEDISRLMRVSYDGVKKGADLETVRSDWETVIENGRRRGAEVFILACTELPIAAAAFGTRADFIDATEALAKAAVRFCGFETV